MSSELAICYVTDLGFLQPTLVAATSLRRFVPPDSASVYIFVMDVDEAIVREVQRTVAHLRIEFVALDSGVIKRLDMRDWNKPGNPIASSHVPVSTIGRFFVDEALPAKISRFLYVDGDTLVVGDLRPLLAFDLPEGRFAAAEDAVSLSRNERGRLGRLTRTYINGLGLSGKEGYFNAGVFLTCRRAWREIASDAVRFLDQHMDRCLYHDQSALNAVVGSRRLLISSMWNFQTRMRLWDCQRLVAPKILHFTEFPKPWMTPIGVWADVHSVLGTLAKDLAPLDLPVQHLTAGEVTASLERQRGWKRSLRSRLNYRIPLRRNALRRVENRALV